MSRILKLSTSKRLRNVNLKVEKLTWDDFKERLKSPIEHDISIEEAKNLEKQKYAELKDTGYYFPGVFEPAIRAKANIKSKSMLTLDADHCKEDETPESILLNLNLYLSCAAFAYTTFSHTSDKPRIRVVVPLLRDVKESTYEPLARYIADEIGIDSFDVTTYQSSRVMFWPAVCSDGEFKHAEIQGGFLDPVGYLTEKGDWKDWKQWPRSTKEPPAREPATRAQDPLSKHGIIGDFCRTFTIPQVIEKFELPYERLEGNRYRHTNSTGPAGAVYYEADNLFYSWHEQDPASGLTNAWDLVRIHTCEGSRLTDGVAGQSQSAMVQKALELPELSRLIADRACFEDVDEEEENENGNDDFKTLSVEIEELTQISPEERKKLSARLATASLTEADLSSLAGMIREKHNRPAPYRNDIVREIKNLRSRVYGEDGSDLDILLINKVLRDNFDKGKHIRRFAKQFWIYDKGVWLASDDEVVRGKAGLTLAGLRTLKTGKLDYRIRGLLEERMTSSILSSHWAMFCSHVANLRDETDPLGLLRYNVPPVINCRNGELVFSRDGTWELRGHDPDNFFTAQLAVEYKSKADTSAWDNFARILFNDSEDRENMVRHLEEVAGYIIQPWRELATFGLMKGKPLAGKSTFGRILNLMLGSASVNREIVRYSGKDNHDTASLVSKLLLLDEDFPIGGLLPDGFLKRISEAKQLTANPKNKSTFEFVSRAMPFVLSNSWPSLRDHSGGVERRALVWELSEIPKAMRDDRKRDTLLGYGMQGAFLRFIEGFGRLYNRGEWDIPEECIKARNRWLGIADSVRDWANNNLVKDKKGFIARTSAHQAYIYWHRDTYPSGRPHGKTTFIERMNRLLGQPLKRNGTLGWVNVRIADEDEEIESE